MPRKKRKKKLSARFKDALGELGLRLLKVAGIALVGMVANYFVHSETESKLANGGAIAITTGAAALLNVNGRKG